MEDILFLVGVPMSYLTTGVLVMMTLERLAGRPPEDRELTFFGIWAWPVVLFVAGVGYFAVRSAAKEVDEL